MRLYDPFQGRVIVLIAESSDQTGAPFIVTYDDATTFFEMWEQQDNEYERIQWVESPRVISSIAHAREWAENWMEKHERIRDAYNG